MLAWFGILKKKLTIIVSEAAATQAEKQPVPTNKDDFLNWARLGVGMEISIFCQDHPKPKMEI